MYAIGNQRSLRDGTVPRYDYACNDCGETFTIRASISEYSEGLKPRCPACESANAERSFGAINVLTGSRAGGSSSIGSCGTGGFT